VPWETGTVTSAVGNLSTTNADLISEAYVGFQAAERAFHDNALFPAFGDGIEIKPGWKKEIARLRRELMRAREKYFTALTTPWYR
jgi:hypothetical protein